MPKDSAMAFIPLDFHKLNLEKNKEYMLTLRLVENENYVPTDIRECVILFSNKDIEAPVWWRSDKLGDYNQEKLILFVIITTSLRKKVRLSMKQFENNGVKIWIRGRQPIC